MIYRDWALGSAVWTQAGNLTTRMKQPHYPQWLLEAPLWTEIWSGPLPGKKLWCVDPADNIRQYPVGRSAGHADRHALVRLE